MAKVPIAIVGGETLLGREIRSVIDERKSPFSCRSMNAGGEEAETPPAEEDERSVAVPLSSESLTGVGALILACGPGPASRALHLHQRAGSSVPFIDLSGASDDRPGSRLRFPEFEAPLHGAFPQGTIHSVAHPAACVVARFLAALHSFSPIRFAVANLLLPASELGQSGVEELQRQTVALLSFKQLPREVFDIQLGFSLLPEYGLEARHPLHKIELRIERHLASLLALRTGIPMPSLRAAQAPVFHGISVSLWADLESEVDPSLLITGLSDAGVDVRGPGLDPPTNVGVAGQSGYAVGSIRADRNRPRGVWFWLVADNLRVAADSAVDVLQSLC